MSPSRSRSRRRNLQFEHQRTGGRNRRKFILSFQDLEMRRLLSVFQVTSTGDNGGVNPAQFAGTGTFRQAIIDSNASGGSNTIGGITAAPGTGAGNLISGASNNGVWITGGGATGDVVEGNLIGTDVSGKNPLGNYDGVEILNGASGNTIGGLIATAGTGAGNLISGNTNDGLEITGSGVSGNLVAGNLIGTNAAGTGALANGAYGVEIDTGASGNTIGGLAATPGTGAGNVISGNAGPGVYLKSGSNVVLGNLIGTNAAGEAAIPNGLISAPIGLINGAVYLTGVGNTIGGTCAGAGNVISGNVNQDVEIAGTGATDDLVAGNYIGLDITGTVKLTSVGGIEVDGPNNTIGGTVAGAANVGVGVILPAT